MNKIVEIPIQNLIIGIICTFLFGWGFGLMLNNLK